jgi:hypothetical protein
MPARAGSSRGYMPLRQRFFRAPGLCAAIFPDLSLSTMNCGWLGEAATLCVLMLAGRVTFRITLPSDGPPLDSHVTASPIFGSERDFFAMVIPLPPADFQTA